jgi:hypothetical protein
MRTYLLTAVCSVIAVFLTVIVWGALGLRLSTFEGALALAGVLIVGAFTFFSWRGRWAGARGATLRGWIAVLILSLALALTPMFAVKTLTGESLVEHGGWWTGESGVLSPARTGIERLGALLINAEASTVDPAAGSGDLAAPDERGADGSGSALADSSGSGDPSEAEGRGDATEVEGAVGDLVAVADGSGQTPEGALALDGSGTAEGAFAPPEGALALDGSGTADAESEGSLGMPEGSLGMPEGDSTDGDAGTSERDSMMPEGEFGSRDAEPEGSVNSGARSPLVPPVEPVVMRGQTLWPSADAPHPLALSLDASSLESLRDAVCELRGAERLRVAHDWIALNINVLPDDRNGSALPTPEERRERARVAFDWRAGTSEAIASLFVELSCGARAVMIRGGDAAFHRGQGTVAYWNAVELRETWLIVDVSRDAGCVPSPDCDRPYRSTHFLAPPRAAIRERIPSPGSFVPYGGDVDIAALLDGPGLGPDFFAAGLALDRLVDGASFEFAVSNPNDHNIRAVIWDSGAAMSIDCRRGDVGPLMSFTCPPPGSGGGRVRLLGQAPEAWTWRELAAWSLQ